MVGTCDIFDFLTVAIFVGNNFSVREEVEGSGTNLFCHIMESKMLPVTVEYRHQF